MTYGFRSGPPRQCRNCGATWTEASNWSDGGWGATCMRCHDLVRPPHFDFVAAGLIRNITPRTRIGFDEKTYDCEAFVDGEWQRYGAPTGSSCFPLDDRGNPRSFYPSNIPVSYWDLKELYRKHYAGKTP